MAGRETRIPKGLVPHRRSGIHRGFSYIAHNRRNVRFKGLWRVHTPPHPRTAHTAAHTAKHGRFGWGWYHYSRSVPHVHQHPRAGYQNGKFCRFGILAGRCSRRTQKTFGTAMRLCVSLFRGVAAPLGCVILFLLSKLWLVCHALRVFPRVRDMGGITTLGALCMFSK